MSTRVKICGITSIADGLAAAEAGADMIGLMFYDSKARVVPHAGAGRQATNRTVLPPLMPDASVCL